MMQKIGQQIRINRSKIKDTSDTNSDFDDLSNACLLYTSDAPRFRRGRQDRVQVTQNRHFAVLAGVRRVIQTGIAVRCV